MQDKCFDDDEQHDEPEYDSRGNVIPPKRTYEIDMPVAQPAQVTVTRAQVAQNSAGERQSSSPPIANGPINSDRYHPVASEARSKTVEKIWEYIDKATQEGNADDLFHEGTISLALGLLEEPEQTSLNADHAAAERIRAHLKKYGLAGKWEKAIRAEKSRRKAADKAYAKERDSAPTRQQEPVEVEDTGETAIQWAATLDTDAIWIIEMLSRMNKEHAVVPFSGGSVRYLHRTLDVYGNPELRFLRPDDFHRLYAHISFNENGKLATASQRWERWQYRTQHAGVGMFPGSEINPSNIPTGYLNLWKGFAVTPNEGRWNLFEEHLYNKVCQCNDKHYNWLMDWLAHIVQKPQEKPGSCVTLKSTAEGTGKSMLSVFMKRILGEHAISVSKSKQIVGDFNGHLAKTVLLTCEEAFWAGDKQAEGALKSLITEGELTIEHKGVDAYSAPNYSRLLTNSNSEWVVPVGTDPRRFFVLEVVNKRANDPHYFQPIWKQMLEDGGVEAMLYDLLDREITENLRFAPSTDALLEQRRQSLSGTERWLLSVAEDGLLRNPSTGEQTNIAVNTDTRTPTHMVREAAKAYCGISEFRNLDRTLGQLLKRSGVSRVKARRGGQSDKAEWVYEFPPAEQFKANVECALKVKVDSHGSGAGTKTLH